MVRSFHSTHPTHLRPTLLGRVHGTLTANVTLWTASVVVGQHLMVACSRRFRFLFLVSPDTNWYFCCYRPHSQAKEKEVKEVKVVKPPHPRKQVNRAVPELDFNSPLDVFSKFFIFLRMSAIYQFQNTTTKKGKHS